MDLFGCISHLHFLEFHNDILEVCLAHISADVLPGSYRQFHTASDPGRKMGNALTVIGGSDLWIHFFIRHPQERIKRKRNPDICHFLHFDGTHISSSEPLWEI